MLNCDLPPCTPESSTRLNVTGRAELGDEWVSRFRSWRGAGTASLAGGSGCSVNGDKGRVLRPRRVTGLSNATDAQCTGSGTMLVVL